MGEPTRREILLAKKDEFARQTDRLLGGLIACQWAAAIGTALVVSPLTWAGATSRVHSHVWAALWPGRGDRRLPVVLALLRPGRVSTRHAIAAGQMLMGALLIHLTGGRIETHFHVFGSLAFLAFYRDWRVLDHGLGRRRRSITCSAASSGPVDLRRRRRRALALARARRLGRLRGRLPDPVLPGRRPAS